VVAVLRRPRGRKRWLATGALLGLEAVTVRSRSGRLGGRVIVRCRSGHLFSTLWIPGASVKSVRLGPWRLQRCPVGRHWSLVTPVKEASLSSAELAAARSARDARVP
jgi:hypothetical protein